VRPRNSNSVSARSRRRYTRGRGWAADIPEARAYQETYERLGKLPGELPSPVDSLGEYIFNSALSRLPQINVVVDLYNLYSLTHFLSNRRA
jgi:DNA/RNA-binding domain of Phe-tRNA-synthetase-like protein